MSAPLFIFHFRPIENYPPIQNFLKVLHARKINSKVICFSSGGNLEPYSEKGVKLVRIGNSKRGKASLWLSYLLFAFIGLIRMIKQKPKAILYYETLSVLPVYLYLKLFNPRLKLFIHYHEYVNAKEYSNGPYLERFLHSLEKSLYRRANWISHTNEARLNKFLVDAKLNYNPLIHNVLPNYPTRDWAIKNTPWKSGDILKVIYVGYSLNPKGNYIKEVIHFFKQQEIQIELNIYCYKQSDYVMSQAGRHSNLDIRLHNSLNYEDLPTVLKAHHLGLILYKAKTENVIHCAPNKLFEYLNCGLDVWYPKEMLGIYPYDSEAEPRVIPFDFSDPNAFKNFQLIREEEERKISSYSAEDVYGKFVDSLLTS